jgi:hypothetical protein
VERRVIDRYGGLAWFVDGARNVFEVTCSFLVVQDFQDVRGGLIAGEIAWHGIFHSDRAAGIEPGDAYMKLVDGRTGHILITDVSFDAGRGLIEGSFVGSGDAPEPLARVKARMLASR